MRNNNDTEPGRALPGLRVCQPSLPELEPGWPGVHTRRGGLLALCPLRLLVARGSALCHPPLGSSILLVAPGSPQTPKVSIHSHSRSVPRATEKPAASVERLGSAPVASPAGRHDDDHAERRLPAVGRGGASRRMPRFQPSGPRCPQSCGEEGPVLPRTAECRAPYFRRALRVQLSGSVVKHVVMRSSAADK